MAEEEKAKKPVTSKGESFSESQHSTLWEVVIGIFLIIIQFVMNKSFLGTGFSKWYFDVVFFCFLFLIFISCRKDFFKAAIISVFAIFFSGILLNHIGALNALASFTHFNLLSQDLLVVVYYGILIFGTSFFAQALIKDETVDYMGTAFIAILSILLPFLIVKFPFSNYLLMSDQTGSLLKLFFSIPLLWQPFWISGLAKAKAQGSGVAYAFLIIWLLVILTITMVVSYVAVPVEARNSLQASGNTAISDIYKGINDTTTTIKDTIINPITKGFNPEEAAIETRVDSEQSSSKKGVSISGLTFDEGTTIEFGTTPSSYSQLFVTGTIVSEGTDTDEYSKFKVNVGCEYVVSGYAGLFTDETKSKITVPGKLNNLEVGEDYNTDLYQIRYDRDLMCSAEKSTVLANLKDPAKIKLATLRANYNLSYDFFTAGYMTRYFIDEKIVDAGREKFGSDEFAIIGEYDSGDVSKYKTSTYTSGPIVVGIEVIKDKLIVPINTESETDSNLNLKIEAKINEYSRGLSITRANDITISIPEAITLGTDCSSVRFKEITPDQLNARIQDYVGGTTGLKFYALDDSSKASFKMDYLNSEKRFSCPITVANSELENTVLKGSIAVFIDYEVKDSKISSDVTPKWVST
ncbi:hypothetical protein JXM83_06635 [Candidatus Woesearchaeota archaeon]|nr:hypothetical protein [Candidatus Woesearchaeota archaeon]